MSLSGLGNVIISLINGAKHVPHRCSDSITLRWVGHSILGNWSGECRVFAVNYIMFELTLYKKEAIVKRLNFLTYLSCHLCLSFVFPYRTSKITRMLQESIGNTSCRTTMIAHVSPSLPFYAETLATVQLATRLHRLRKRKGKVTMASLYQIIISVQLIDVAKLKQTFWVRPKEETKTTKQSVS